MVWFNNGQLNVSYNCVDRHALVDPDRIAIIYEADQANSSQKVSYGELLKKVCQFANVLKKYGIK
jgi:acetyl-CoA synthetase